MKNQTLLLITLVSILVAGPARADAPPQPRTISRQADVIVPMLSRYSPKDTSKESVMADLSAILGKYDNDGFGGQPGSYWTFYSYQLDDSTQIIVEFISKSGHGNPDLVLILAQLPDGKIVRLGGISLASRTPHGRQQSPG